MKTKRFLKKGFCRIAAALCALCVLALSGCTDAKKETTPVIAAEKPSYVTCYGTVVWRLSYPLSFPFALPILQVAVRNGQTASAGDVLFYIDISGLTDQKDALESAKEALENTKSCRENELLQLRSELALCSLGAEQFTAAEVMTLLLNTAKDREKTSAFTQNRLSLIGLLDRYGLLAYYDQLLGYANGKDSFYYKQANPLLMQIEQSFDGRVSEITSLVYEKTADLCRTEAELKAAEQSLGAMEAFLSGSAYNGILLAKDGAVSVAQDGFLVDNIITGGYIRLSADAPVLDRIDPDSFEILCYAEEQLAGGIRVGDAAQVSLFSDSASVALGTVSFVSRIAELREGETMIAVVIAAEDSGFLPGYNVVARITPADPE